MKNIIKYVFAMLLSVTFIAPDLVAQSGNRHGKFTNQFKNIVKPNQIKAKFKKMQGGIIFIQAKVNGKNEWFILDSGAPGLVMNARYFKHAEEVGNAGGVSGMATTSKVKVKSFDWQGIKIKDFESMAIELSQLEKQLSMPIRGLIGVTMLKEYELMIDYHKEELTLFKQGKSKYHNKVKPVLEIPAEMQKHIPVIKVRIGSKKLRFGIDTGAGVNLISDHKFEKLSEKDYKLLGTQPLQGANKGTTIVKQIHIKNTKIAQNNFKNMEYVVNNIDHLRERKGVKIDGLLGVPFLSAKGKVSINYTKSKIYFWE